jgi:hypothetical protein
MPADGSDAHYLVMCADREGVVRPAFYRRVSTASDRSDGGLGIAPLGSFRRGVPLALSIVDGYGNVGQRTWIDISHEIRGEFQGRLDATGNLGVDAYRVETAESCFVARLRTRPEEMLLVDGRGRVVFKLDDQIPDESPFPGYPRCSDLVFGCEANVTDETEPSRIKWSGWIDAGTPIPTPEDQAYASMPGLFEGARYLETGMYRPRLNCMMRSLGAPFCEVCSQEYVRVLYGGGWGSPAVGIDPIEPTVGGPNARTPQSSEIGTRGRSSSSSSSSLRGEALD